MAKTLLLADDSVTIQKVVGIAFASEDIDLVTVDNGDDAVARAKEVRPDAVLADVVMPGMNGYEVCEALKADPSLQHVPVLLLTGTFEAFDDERARAAGAAGHVAKPFEAQVLVERVREILAAQPAVAPTPAADRSDALTPPIASGSAGESFDFFDDDLGDLAPEQAASAELAAPAVGRQEPDLSGSDAAFAFGDDELSPAPPESVAASSQLPAAMAAAPPDSTVAIMPDDLDAMVPAAPPTAPVATPMAPPAPPMPPVANPTPAAALPEPADDLLSADLGGVPADPSRGADAFDFEIGDSPAAREVGLVSADDLAAASVLDPKGASGFDVSYSDLSAAVPGQAPPAPAEPVMTPPELAQTPPEAPLAPLAEAVAPLALPTDQVTPPADQVVPPADQMTPPADQVMPPADQMTPPADQVMPPADQMTPPAAPLAPPPPMAEPVLAAPEPPPLDPPQPPAGEAPSLASLLPPIPEPPPVFKGMITPEPPQATPGASVDAAEPVGSAATPQSATGDPDAPIAFEQPPAPAFEPEPSPAADPLPIEIGERPYGVELAGDSPDSFDDFATPAPRVPASEADSLFDAPAEPLSAAEAAAEASLDEAFSAAPLAGPPDFGDSASDLRTPASGIHDPSALAGMALAEVTPQLRDQLHDTLEKIAWESFGAVAEQIVRQAVEKAEQIAWEVIPPMAETLIREEIRRMKGESED